jgi:hypothetical protein
MPPAASLPSLQPDFRPSPRRGKLLREDRQEVRGPIVRIAPIQTMSAPVAIVPIVSITLNVTMMPAQNRLMSSGPDGTLPRAG